MPRLIDAARRLTGGSAARLTIVAVVVAVALGAALGDAATSLAAGALVAALVAAIVALDLRRSDLRLAREVERTQRQVLLVDAEVDRVRDMVRDLSATVESKSLADVRQIEASAQMHAAVRPRRSLPASRGWAASPDFLLALFELVVDVRPRLIVECGSGLSTIVMGYACEQVGRGRVVALEHDPGFAAETRRSVERHGLAKFVEVRVAPLSPLPAGASIPAPAPAGWYDSAGWADLDGIDVVVVDGPPEASGLLARLPTVPLLAARLAREAFVVLDDADRDDEREIVRRWVADGLVVILDAPPTEKGMAILARPPSHT